MATTKHFTFRAPSDRWADAFEDTRSYFQQTRSHALRLAAEWYACRGLLRRLAEDAECRAGFGDDLEEITASLQARLKHLENAAHPGPTEREFNAHLNLN